MTNNIVKVEPVYGPQGNKGEQGFSPLVRESPDNTSTIYKLLITDAEHTIETPNLMTDIHQESVQTAINCAKDARIYSDNAKEQSEIASENTLTVIDKAQIVTQKAEDIDAKSIIVTSSVETVQNCLTSAQEILDTINTKSFSTVRIGAVTTVESGESVKVSNSGTDKDIVLDFKIPCGERGLQGEQGIQGNQGQRGDTALTLSIGTVTTIDSDRIAIVTNSGTQSNIVLDIQIPRGTQGIQGIQGEKGIQGEQGINGEGVPLGGTQGQVLTKSSETNYDTKWSDPKGGGGGTINPVLSALNTSRIVIMPNVSIYKEFVTAATTFVIDISNLDVSDTDCIHFQLYLQNLTASIANFNASICWANGNIPNFKVTGKYKIELTSFDKGETWIGNYLGTYTTSSFGGDTPIIENEWKLCFNSVSSASKLQLIVDDSYNNTKVYNAPIRIDWGDGTPEMEYTSGDIIHYPPSGWVGPVEVTIKLDENNSMPWFTWGYGKEAKSRLVSSSPNRFIGKLPKMYRMYNSIAYDVTDFTYWANHLNTPILPDYFFDNNPNITSMFHCFDQNTRIKSLGKQPFRTLRSLNSLQYMCYNCASLELESDMFGDEETRMTEDFSINQANFNYAFYCYSVYDNLPRGTAPRLWEYKYNNFSISFQHCFEGDGNKLLTNYAEIPATWKTKS